MGQGSTLPILTQREDLNYYCILSLSFFSHPQPPLRSFLTNFSFTWIDFKFYPYFPLLPFTTD